MNEFEGDEKKFYDLGKSLVNRENGFYAHILAVCPTKADFKNFERPLR